MDAEALYALKWVSEKVYAPKKWKQGWKLKSVPGVEVSEEELV